MRKKFIGMGIVVLALIAAGLITYVLPNNTEIDSGTSEASLIYDPSDVRQVVGAYHNVFTGKVIEKLKPTAYDAIPQSQYLVEVIDNIKGRLDEKAVVSQLDGLAFSDGLEKVPALRVGSAYLFATRENPDTGWNVLSPHPSGIRLLSEDKNLNAAQLLELSEQDQRVNEMREAYKYEIIPQADLAAGNVRNAYADSENANE